MISEITPELSEALSELSSLIEQFQSTINGHQLPKNGTTSRIRIAFAMAVALISYAEGIHTLASHIMSNACLPLLRPMLEGQQTLAYLLQKDGDTRVIAYAALEASATAGTMERIKKYMLENNILQFGSSTPKDFENMIIERQQILKEFEQSIALANDPEFPPKKGFPKLKDRVQIYDAASGEVDPQKTHYFSYLTVYSYMSGGVHLGIDGIAGNLQKTDSQISLDPNDDAQTAQLAVYTAFALLGETFLLVLTELGIEHATIAQWINDTAVSIASSL